MPVRIIGDPENEIACKIGHDVVCEANRPDRMNASAERAENHFVSIEAEPKYLANGKSSVDNGRYT